MLTNNDGNRMKLSEVRTSFLAATMIIYNLICAILQQAMPLNISYGNLVALIIIIIVFFDMMDNMFYTMSPKIILLCIYIISAMLISSIFIGARIHEYLISFLFFGLVGCYIGAQKINTEFLLRFLIYFSYLPLLFINALMLAYSRESSTNVIMEMGISYALLPLVFAALLHFIYYRKTSNFFIKFGYFINAIFLLILLITGTRGGVFSFYIFVTLILANKYDNNNYNLQQVHNNRRKWVWLSMGSIIVLIFYYDHIIFVINPFFAELGININILTKTQRLINATTDSSNGRFILWKAAFDGILASPIWGYGWGHFKELTGQSHPHNLILELLYEGGLLLALPILLPTFYGVYKCVVGHIKNKEDYVFLIFLISSSLPRLMFSASLWNIQIFWMMLSFMIVQIPVNVEPITVMVKGEL